MSVQTADDASERGYFVWRAKHPSEAELLDDIPRDIASALWADAWRAGSWDTLKRNSTLGINLSQIIQRLEELARLFAEDQVERALSDETERVSAYWHEEQLPF